MHVSSFKHAALQLCQLALAAAAGAWDTSYSYQTVFDANAATYIVGQENVRRYMEWQDPAVTYWGPAANDVTGILTSRFTFSAPTADMALRFRLNSSKSRFQRNCWTTA